MREWLSGRASPCQGECRESESRLPLHKWQWHLGQVVRQSSAKALFSSPNLEGASKIFYKKACVCRVGGIGRREGLKIPWSKGCAGSSPAPGTKKDLRNQIFFLFNINIKSKYLYKNFLINYCKTNTMQCIISYER